MESINIRNFSRNVYTFVKKLPVVVYNKKTGRILFVVISPEKGKEVYDLSIEDIIQPKRNAS